MHSFTSSKITLTLGQQVIEKIYMFHTSGCNFICGVCREGGRKEILQHSRCYHFHFLKWFWILVSMDD